MRLKNMSDFRELCFIMTMLNVICTADSCTVEFGHTRLSHDLKIFKD